MTISPRRIEELETEIAQLRKDVDQLQGMFGLRKMKPSELKNVRVFLYAIAVTFTVCIQILLSFFKYFPDSPVEIDNQMFILLTIGNLVLLFLVCVLINRSRGPTMHKQLSQSED